MKYKIEFTNPNNINRKNGIFERKVYKENSSILENKDIKIYIDDFKIEQGFADEIKSITLIN